MTELFLAVNIFESLCLIAYIIRTRYLHEGWILAYWLGWFDLVAVYRPVMVMLSMPAPHGPEDAAPQYQNLFFDVKTHRFVDIQTA